MTKKTKMYLGLGVLAVAAYYFWNKSKQANTTPSIKANLSGPCPSGQEFVGLTPDRTKILCITSDGGRNYIPIKYTSGSAAKDSTNKK